VSDSPPKREKKSEWVLTDAAFAKLLAWLNDVPERAGTTYEVTRSKLILFFSRERCLWPEDQTDETLNRVARKLLEGGIDEGIKPITFIIAVAKHVLMEDYRKPERKGLPIDKLPIDQQLAVHSRRSEDPRRNDEKDEAQRLEDVRARCYEKCLKELQAGERNTLLKYYTGESGEKIELRKRLAKKLGISRKALIGRVLRYEKKLLECVENCRGAALADEAKSANSH
jgi:DNA-directed RNA polymerase specialized sigma24 family protein